MKRLLLAMTTGLLLVGCGSSAPQAGPSATSPTPVTPTQAPCPIVPTAHFRWPAPVPADLPQPPTAVLGMVNTTPQGLTIVRFRTTTSLQQSVLFVVKEIQKAGFTLGRGDAEPAEADAPFGRGDLRGVYKMLARDTCATDWLVAVTKSRPTGNSPILPRQTTASPSPLPFG